MKQTHIKKINPRKPATSPQGSLEGPGNGGSGGGNGCIPTI